MSAELAEIISCGCWKDCTATLHNMALGMTLGILPTAGRGSRILKVWTGEASQQTRETLWKKFSKEFSLSTRKSAGLHTMLWPRSEAYCAAAKSAMPAHWTRV